MFSFIRRHRRKLFIVGGIIGGAAFLNSYLKKKFVAWGSSRTAELSDQIRRSSHFENTMSSCDDALISFSPKIREIICSILDVNPLVEQLRQNSHNKVQLWEQLKVLVFTQAIGEMYSQCLLSVLLRVQMSILGGYIFSASSSNSENSVTSNSSGQMQYLSSIANFLSSGINYLLNPIQKEVEDILCVVPLNRPLKLQDVEDIIKSICDHISQREMVLPNISSYLMPTPSTSAANHEFLEQISTETQDVLECQDFRHVLSISIECGISSLMDRLSECYVFLSDGKSTFVNPHDFSAPLAKIIPMMHNVFSQHEPTEQGALVHALLHLEPLNKFAANIYETFSQID